MRAKLSDNVDNDTGLIRCCMICFNHLSKHSQESELAKEQFLTSSNNRSTPPGMFADASLEVEVRPGHMWQSSHVEDSNQLTLTR